MLLRRLIVALALAAVTTFVTAASPALRLNAPYLLPMAGVMTAGWYAGLWAGLLSCFATMLAIDYVLLPPAFSLRIASPDDLIRLSIFAVVSLFMSTIIDRGRRNAATLQATLASIDDAVIVTDRQARVTFMNPVAERLTGWTLKSAIGRSVAGIYRIVDEKTREPYSSRIEGMLRDGVLRESTILGPSMERMLLSLDGSEHPVVESGSSVIDENGDRLGAVLVFRDVSHQRAAREAAERANRLKDEFLATVSHELRTPLNAVLGWTKMLRGGTMPAGSTTRAIEAIDRNADALATLVNDLLDVSRIASGQLRLKPEETDVVQLVRDSLDALGPSLSAKGLQLDAHIEEVPRLVVDPDRLRQVIWNLLSNAMKFTPAGGRIGIRLQVAGALVQIAVTDSGQGIAPEQLSLVFNRFWQADAAPTRTTGGLGLGLAIVRHLVEAHDGSIVANSDGLGKGATFTVSLPLPAAASPPAPVERAVVSTELSAVSLTGLKVLAVDDEWDSLELVVETLRSCGAEVCTAGSAEEAIVAFRATKPHVLVADIGMPGQDGYALLRRLRSEPLGSDVPAIALTAYAGEQHRKAALDAGFNEHVEKPVNPDHLAALVGHISRRAV